MLLKKNTREEKRKINKIKILLVAFFASYEILHFCEVVSIIYFLYKIYFDKQLLL